MKHRVHPSILSFALITLIMAIAAPALHAQGPRRSIMQIDRERYGRYNFEREEQWDSLNNHTPSPRVTRQGVARQSVTSQGVARGNAASAGAACTLEKRVFGWNPYWEGTAYESFDFSLLSDVCYFSYEVDPATGNYSSIHSWKTTALVDRAKEAGTRVHLCATLFSGIAGFLSNPAARATLIDSLVALVKLRGANGVNIDFEGVPAASRAAMTSFMADLGTRFHGEIPGSQISIALPAVDWSNAFDVAAMAPHVDLFLIMGYDYHWRSSADAGPVAPRNSGTLWGTIDVTRSINNYLGKGIPPSKLALAVPYYGYDWPTVDSTIGAATTGPGVATLYASARQGALLRGRRWEPQSSTPYYVYRAADSAWHQTWYDDEESLRLKYDLVKMKELAGIGIWALGYDDDRPELWGAIRSTLTSCAASPCSGTFTDMGGSAGNYYDGENYRYTIAPEHAASVTLSFFSFNIANDRLAIYDGRDTTAPLIGVFTGTASPGTITGTHGALTLKFTSGTGDNSWGWIANWTCSQLPQSVPATPSPATIGGLRALPNPASGSISIEYDLRATAHVRLSIFDMLGAERSVLFDGTRGAGRHGAYLDNRDRALPAGRYFVRLRAGEIVRDIAVTIVE